MNESSEHWLDRVAKRLAMRASRRESIARGGAGLLGGALAALLPRRVGAYALTQCAPGSGTAQCPPGTACIAGLCLQPYQSSYCPPGSSYCGGQCINTQSDPNHCGGCNVQCPYGVACTLGACTRFESALAPVCPSIDSQSTAGPNALASVSGSGLTVTAFGIGGGGQISLVQCGANPGPSAPPGANEFFDLRLAPGSSYSSVLLFICSTTGSGLSSATLYWMGKSGGWQSVFPISQPAAGGCLAVTLNSVSSPSLQISTGARSLLPCSAMRRSCRSDRQRALPRAASRSSIPTKPQRGRILSQTYRSSPAATASSPARVTLSAAARPGVWLTAFRAARVRRAAPGYANNLTR